MLYACTAEVEHVEMMMMREHALIKLSKRTANAVGFFPLFLLLVYYMSYEVNNKRKCGEREPVKIQPLFFG